MKVELSVEPHERLCLRAFVTELPRPLVEMSAPPGAEAVFAGVAPELEPPDDLRGAVRDVFRGFGYKPTGRGKPSSEYLAKLGREGLPRINAVVDGCNAASFSSGLPISVVDLDRSSAPWRVAVAEPGTEYVFNAGGQVIDVSGLLCLFDAEGPCANAVKDAQRTKTRDETRTTLSIVWGARSAADHTERAAAWYRGLWEAVEGVRTTLVG